MDLQKSRVDYGCDGLHSNCYGMLLRLACPACEPHMESQSRSPGTTRSIRNAINRQKNLNQLSRGSARADGKPDRWSGRKRGALPRLPSFALRCSPFY